MTICLTSRADYRCRCRSPSRQRLGTAGTVHDVGEIGRLSQVLIEGDELVLARGRKAAGGVDDAGPNRGGNADATIDLSRPADFGGLPERYG